ncbi:dimethylsulfoniopropionate demethylase [Leisingera sp. ANG-Vp]|uniref:dimethylsulfoniopropionate demethylase n=1 Tax=Leisingera sp. ANG-Vp TaxID=1577896 RepID=UPI00057F95C4|nr:dimethylsulfoniopropionate demethylase [Leisingera sp. ANG-Vp]KIC20367.1 dimethyl sulfoniopropionate demethylase [Leisingera sp. ANG-Vp]
MADGLNMSRRIRRTPYTDRVEQAGVRGFSVVNHMLLPKAFQPSIEEDYWHLREHVQLWDVSCQRQVQIAGPDAERLVQWMTPRRISTAKIGDCYYIPIVDRDGGLINDPVMLKIADDRFWLSIADSDVLLYALGLAEAKGFDVQIDEPDVSPLAVQGPKAEDLMASVFGEEIRSIGFFKYKRFDFRGTSQVIARSGYSRQGGFEIYLDDSSLGHDLWDTLWEAGQAFSITPGCPNLIERIEGGLFSYGNEMTRENNPLEYDMAKFIKLDGSVDCIGLAALQRIAEEGVSREIRGIVFGGGRVPTCSKPWPVMVGDRQVGQITSGVWSPRLEANVGLSLIDRGFWDIGQELTVLTPDELERPGRIAKLPIE